MVAASERADDQSWAGPAQSNPSRRAWWPPARSVDAARTSAQCHLVFPIPPTCINGGADARVRTRPPGRLVDGGKRLILREKSGTRASRADQGVRPPIMPNPQLCETKWHCARVRAPHLPVSQCEVILAAVLSSLSVVGLAFCSVARSKCPGYAAVALGPSNRSPWAWLRRSHSI